MDCMYTFTLLHFMLTWMYVKGTILDLKLVDGNSPYEGRVEINVEGIGWNTICASSWDMSDAMVTCRQLGFSGAQLDLQSAAFGTGTAPKYKKTFLCKGDENNLDGCRMQTATCAGGSSVAGTVCQDDLYLGCYGDDPQDRPFSGAAHTNSTHMSIDYCRSFCSQHGFEYAGLEYGSECYCGSASANYSVYGRYRDSDCRHVCSGNNLQTCGGIAKIAVHFTALPSTKGPSTIVSSPSPDDSNQSTKPSSESTTTETSTKQLALQLENEKVKMMTTMMRIFAVLFAICCVIIIGCVVWNYKLRSRLKESYNVSKKDNANRDTALPYMALSERRPPAESENYQGLSVQRKQGQAVRGRDPDAREGAYATSILMGEPVYQEPAVYMEPEELPGYRVGLPGKPGEPEADDGLLGGGGNDYEMFGT